MEDFSQHVDRYRIIVRTGWWPNEDRATSFGTFCSEYLQSTVSYANVGFDALAFLAGSTTWTLGEIFQRVVASEALRGQFGKRSPTGLDRRLDQSVEKLEAIVLDELGGHAINDQINLLCTPTEPWVSAEAALMEDFAVLRNFFPSPPSIAEILAADASRQETVWTFLRRHVRWNVERLQRYYMEFGTSMFDRWLFDARQQRIALAEQRRSLLAEISDRARPEAANDIVTLAEEATILNHLNLALEPCFSFKGGPGVPHGLIFRAAANSELGLQIAQDRLLIDKWELFYSTTIGG